MCGWMGGRLDVFKNGTEKKERKEKRKRWKLINEPVISFCLLETLVFSFQWAHTQKNAQKENMVGILYSFFALTNYY